MRGLLQRAPPYRASNDNTPHAQRYDFWDYQLHKNCFPTVLCRSATNHTQRYDTREYSIFINNQNSFIMTRIEMIDAIINAGIKAESDRNSLMRMTKEQLQAMLPSDESAIAGNSLIPTSGKKTLKIIGVADVNFAYGTVTFATNSKDLVLVCRDRDAETGRYVSTDAELRKTKFVTIKVSELRKLYLTGRLNDVRVLNGGYLNEPTLLALRESFLTIDITPIKEGDIVNAGTDNEYEAMHDGQQIKVLSVSVDRDAVDMALKCCIMTNAMIKTNR